jgi:signal transduction histidine kinase
MLGIRKKSLRNRLLLSVFLASIIPYIIGGWYIQKIIIDQAQQNYLLHTQQEMDEVQRILEEGFLGPVEQLVSTLADDERVTGLGANSLTRYLQSGRVPPAGPAESALNRYFNSVRKNNFNIGSLFIGTKWGGYLEDPPINPQKGYDPRERPWYKQAIARPGTAVISDPYVTEFTGRMVVSIVHDFRDSHGARGVVGAMMYLSEFQRQVNKIRIGRTGYMMVLDPNNKLIVSPVHPEWLLKSPNEIPVAGFRNLTEKVGRLTAVYVDGKEKEMLVGAPDRRGWRTVAVIDKNEIEEQVAPIRNTVAEVYCVTMLFILMTVTYASTRIIRPLRTMLDLTSRMANGELETPEIAIAADDELGQLARSFRIMANNLKKSYEDLEVKVEIRTQELTATNEELRALNDELQSTLSQLEETQVQLLQAEKSAALSRLVAGVAHEINTPVGVAVTAVSHIEYVTTEVTKRYAGGTLKRSDLNEYLDNVQEAMQIVHTNLNRAANLIRSFKQVSVDQVSEVRRKFKIKEYLGEILLSLSSKLKNTGYSVEIECDDHLEMYGYPGVFAQVVTNLLMNSLMHAFEPGDNGEILIKAVKRGTQIIFSYRDNGKGMKEEVRKRIFEPFFTTNRSAGGTGLGLAIVYNIVTQQFGGTVECQSAPGQGVIFTFTLPVEEEDPA